MEVTTIYLQGSRSPDGRNVILPLPSCAIMLVVSYTEPSAFRLAFVQLDHAQSLSHSVSIPYSGLSSLRHDFMAQSSVPLLIRNVLLPALQDQTHSMVRSGLCVVVRHLVKVAHALHPSQGLLQLLGFRQGSLRMCAEVSGWTKLCEVELPYSVASLLAQVNSPSAQPSAERRQVALPADLLKLEAHFEKPPKIHNDDRLRRSQLATLQADVADPEKCDAIVHNCRMEGSHFALERMTPLAHGWSKFTVHKDMGEQGGDDGGGTQSLPAVLHTSEQGHVAASQVCELIHRLSYLDIHFIHLYSEGIEMTIADLCLFSYLYFLLESVEFNVSALTEHLPHVVTWLRHMVTLPRLQMAASHCGFDFPRLKHTLLHGTPQRQKENSCAEGWKKNSSAEGVKENSGGVEGGKKNSSAEGVKENSGGVEGGKKNSAEGVKENSGGVEGGKKNSSAEGVKENSGGVEGGKKNSSAEGVKENSGGVEGGKKNSSAEGVKENSGGVEGGKKNSSAEGVKENSGGVEGGKKNSSAEGVKENSSGVEGGKKNSSAEGVKENSGGVEGGKKNSSAEGVKENSGGVEGGRKNSSAEGVIENSSAEGVKDNSNAGKEKENSDQDDRKWSSCAEGGEENSIANGGERNICAEGGKKNTSERGGECDSYAEGGEKDSCAIGVKWNTCAEGGKKNSSTEGGKRSGVYFCRPPMDEVTEDDMELSRRCRTKYKALKPEVQESLNSMKERGIEPLLGSHPRGSAVGLDWDHLPTCVHPKEGEVPIKRVQRKCQQLENLVTAVMEVAHPGDIIVDFCSGGGHLGLAIAHLLPQCTVYLVENKEESLWRAQSRMADLSSNNVVLYQCNLDYFVGRFDVGVCLHACGSATDMVLQQCLDNQASFVICPCCYGSIQQTHLLSYPRSCLYQEKQVTYKEFLTLGHAADQTEFNIALEQQGRHCMNLVDSDRAQLAREAGYTVTLTSLQPLTCSPKNNLLIGHTRAATAVSS